MRQPTVPDRCPTCRQRYEPVRQVVNGVTTGRVEPAHPTGPCRPYVPKVYAMPPLGPEWDEPRCATWRCDGDVTWRKGATRCRSCTVEHMQRGLAKVRARKRAQGEALRARWQKRAERREAA